MVEIFKHVDKFFTSLTNYLTYNYIFIIFVGLFLFSILCVIFFTSRAYEARLIKAIDKFNSYFIDNPQINEDNLVAFNNKMKHRKVPKQLRKSWQQFVLYREDKASKYMSFENCVSNPIKNSTYKRDVRLLSTLAWIFSLCALILNCYYCYEVTDIATALSKILLTPVIILLLNYIIQIFLNLRHNAIVSDLFQNYQYFEVNIDKATETLPEYVDYEVLFDRNEIKKGIPILYAYLQKRAEEEQRQLERARLKNVEHEKFNFDDQGVAASLVLERAMQEAENYIAERKKYTQDIGQINADITQEDMNYREITKEYNRQMQVSKETFANFKSQLEDVSSTIEANYLKKQQQQELDRQRNLERDFDLATEKHKKIIESYHAELDTIDGFIAQSRKNLEDAMKSEFGSYSGKVYDEAKKVAEQNVKDKLVKFKHDLVTVEEKLVTKEQQLKESYDQSQQLNEKLQLALLEIDNLTIASKKKNKKNKNRDENQYEQPYSNVSNTVTNAQVVQQPTEEVVQDNSFNEVPQMNQEVNSEFDFGTSEKDDFDTQFDIPSTSTDVEFSEFDNTQEEASENFDFNFDDDSQSNDEYFTVPEFETEPVENKQNDFDEFDFEPSVKEVEEVPSTEDFYKYDSTEQTDESVNEKPASRRGRPRKVVDADTKPEEKKKPGRPRKEVSENKTEEKRGRGRPRKEVDDEHENTKKRGPGRPRKVADADAKSEEKKKPGRPRKEVGEIKTEEKRGRGRPRKEVDDEPKASKKRGRGRPKKETTEKVKTEEKRGRGRPRKDAKNVNDEIENIDAYLKEIDDAIAAENAKLEETQKELAKKAKLKRKK